VIDTDKNALDLLKQRQSFARGLEPASIADEKIEATFLRKPGEQLADGRLRDTERMRGACRASKLEHRFENL